MRSLLSEVMAGTVAVLSGVTAAFLLALDKNGSVLIFLLIGFLVLCAAATVLMQRLHWHNTSFVQHLRDQLPGEVLCRLRGRGVSCVTASELVDLLGDHIREQQELLNSQFSQNILSQGSTAAELDESNITLQLLRAELTALEDQFNTDVQRDMPQNKLYREKFHRDGYRDPG